MFGAVPTSLSHTYLSSQLCMLSMHRTTYVLKNYSSEIVTIIQSVTVVMLFFFCRYTVLDNEMGSYEGHVALKKSKVSLQ